MVSTGLKCNHNQVCGGMRVEGGWKSLIGSVVGENQLFGVWWLRSSADV